MNEQERQDVMREIVDEAEHYIDDFHDCAYVARNIGDVILEEHNSNGEMDYCWDYVEDIREVRMADDSPTFSFSDEDGTEYSNLPIRTTIFNRKAQAMLDRHTPLDIDPNNPDESDFVPVSNYK